MGNRRGRLLLLATTGAALVGLTGCAPSSPPHPTSSTVTVVPTQTVAPTDTASPSSDPSAGATASGSASDPNRPSDQCADDHLKVTVRATKDGGAAGSVFADVVFTNTGSASCALRGYPGVSVVGDGNGTQLGKPAKETGAAVATKTLAPGGSVQSTLRSTNIAAGGGPYGSACKEKSGDGYRVYPPHSTRAFFVRETGVAACTSDTVWMSVGPVAAS